MKVASGVLLLQMCWSETLNRGRRGLELSGGGIVSGLLQALTMEGGAGGGVF